MTLPETLPTDFDVQNLSRMFKDIDIALTADVERRMRLAIIAGDYMPSTEEELSLGFNVPLASFAIGREP